MPTCPFKDCGGEAENLNTLLAHVRVRHGAVAWNIGTLRSALKERGVDTEQLDTLN